MSTVVKERNDRILVIDDNPAIHEDFRKVLNTPRSRRSALAETEAMLFGDASQTNQPINFQIDSAYQGEDGVEMVQRSLAAGLPYALAFADVRMPPGWDGIETITRICQIDPALQIVICTAYSDYSWEEMTRNVGVSENILILKKPFDNIEVMQLAHVLTPKWFLNQQHKCRLNDLDDLVTQRTQELRTANYRLKSEVLERQLAEQALRLSEERFSKAFNSSPIPMAIQRPQDERYIDVNHRFLPMTALGRDDVIGHSPTELKLWIDPEERRRMLEKLRRDKTIRNWPCRLRAQTGDVREVLLCLELFNLGNEPYLLSITEDLTERRLLENQLRHAQKLEAIGKLAAGVAHDFNNLLTIIQGYTSLSLNRPTTEPELHPFLTEVLNAAGRAATLTRQLLAFSRKQVMQTTAVDVTALIGQLTQMLSRLIGEDFALHVSLPPSLPRVLADAGNIEQVLMNLVVNARDAMSRGGRVTISAAQVGIDAEYVRRNSEGSIGQFVCLSVTDTGCGMDLSTQARLFEPFFTTKDIGKGTGMGLATAYGIIKQHGGWIEVSSEVGVGSTFKVYLPICTSPIESAVIHQAPPSVTLMGHETILVVVDEEGILDLMAKILEMHGYRTLAALNPDRSLEVWKANHGQVDLLLTDLVLPNGMTGQELATKLVAEKPNLKVIYTSGYSSSLLDPTAVPKEAFTFLQKPYQAEVLAQIVRNCLDAKPNK